MIYEALLSRPHPIIHSDTEVSELGSPEGIHVFELMPPRVSFLQEGDDDCALPTVQA